MGVEELNRSPRLRQLSAGQQQRLEALRRVSRLLDSAIEVPGTRYRVGLDPILGLLPGLGDLISPLFTIGILWQAREFRIPRVVQLRMLFNVAIDSLVGVIPIFGDVFDFAWKANDRNMALLQRHAYEQRMASGSDWLFVTLLILLLVLIAVTPFLILAWVINGVGAHS